MSNVLSIDIEAETDNLNRAKELVLGQLLKDKVISVEQSKEYSQKWQIIVFKRSWFRLWASVFGNNDSQDEYSLKFVKFED